jgi:hypothetical protein
LKQKFVALFGRFALVFFGICFALVILEAIFRILYLDPSPKLINQGLQFHEIYRLAFKPDVEGWNTSLRGEYSTYIKINNKGLRGRGYAYKREENTFRILILGDSFTAGLQVPEEETFSKMLETQLQQHYPQTKFEVINAGIVGYGTDNQLAYFTHEGYKYQPDLVLLAFFTGNDITDNISQSLYELVDGHLIPVAPPQRTGALVQNWTIEEAPIKKTRHFLYTNSRLYSVSIELMTYSAIQKIPALVDMLVSLGFVEITTPLVNYGNFYTFRYLPEKAWLKTEALILQLNQEVEAHGSQLVIAVLPDESDVDQNRRAEILETYAHLTTEQTINGPPPAIQLGQILQKNNILQLQLLTALQNYRQKIGEPLYYKYDGHWTPAGHQVAGQAIYNYLIENRDMLNNFPK